MMKLSISICPTVLHVCGLCYLLALCIKDAMFVADLQNRMDAKREAEAQCTLRSINTNIVLVVEQDCTYKIFNKILGTRKSAFIHKDNDGRVSVETEYKHSGLTHYILSPHIPLIQGYKCHYYDYKNSQNLNRTLMNIYNSIFNKVHAAGYGQLKLDELSYQKTAYKNFDLIIFKIEELGEARFTNYYVQNDMMSRLTGMLSKLRSIPKNSISKTDWSSEAVSMLMRMLVNMDVLRYTVDLSMYPELVPILFPFRFVDNEFSQWTAINIITLGLDLRNVKASSMAHFFNMRVVDRLCRSGGYYAITAEY